MLEAESRVSDLADWVKASYAASVPDYVLRAVIGRWYDRRVWRDAGGELITRPFSPDMSARTVDALSHEWHEAVANHVEAHSNQPFPPPWFPSGMVDGFTFTPVGDSAGLYREGKAMRTCVGPYASSVLRGDCYIYSVTASGKRVATLELVNEDCRPVLQQLRGHCNSVPPRSVAAAVRKWLRSHSDVRIAATAPAGPTNTLGSRAIDDLDDLNDLDNLRHIFPRIGLG